MQDETSEPLRINIITSFIFGLMAAICILFHERYSPVIIVFFCLLPPAKLLALLCMRSLANGIHDAVFPLIYQGIVCADPVVMRSIKDAFVYASWMIIKGLGDIKR